MKLIMLGSGTSTGVPRIGNDWGSGAVFKGIECTDIDIYKLHIVVLPSSS